MMTFTTGLEMTEAEIKLVEISIRTQIDQLYRHQDSDNPSEALEKHKKIFELMQLLKKLNRYRSALNFDLDCIGIPLGTA